jgi:hypothetical protein
MLVPMFLSLIQEIIKKQCFFFVLCGSTPFPATPMLAEIDKGSACYAHRQDRLRGRKGEKQHFVMLAVEGVIVKSSPVSQEEAVELVENY